MTYSTITILNELLVNEYNKTNTQWRAVRSRLREIDKVVLDDSVLSSMGPLKEDELYKKLDKLREIEIHLSEKVGKLTKAMKDFDEHHW